MNIIFFFVATNSIQFNFVLKSPQDLNAYISSILQQTVKWKNCGSIPDTGMEKQWDNKPQISWVIAGQNWLHPTDAAES